MASEKLSRKQDRALHNALASVVLTAFPNPERDNCPGHETLLAIARKKLPMHDARGEHVTRCSPCFSELRGIQTDIRHQRTLLVASATAAVLIAVVMLGYVAFQMPAVERSIPGSILPTTQVEMVDLRKFSAVRSTEPPTTTANAEIPRLRRGVLQLVIQLPVGADEGLYELEIRNNDDQSPLTAAQGEAKIENYVTTVRARVDTSRIPQGEYRLALRHPGFGWRSYPVMLQ